MEKQIKILMSAFFILILTLSLGSAMIVKSVEANNFQPGSKQTITLNVKNTLNNDAGDVSLTLDMTGIPFSVVDSGDSVNKIASDDNENFDLIVQASNDAKAGTYQIPYTLNYNINGTQIKRGTFALTVEANPELTYSISTDSPIVGNKGKIILNIVNQGLGEAKFVNVLLIPDGYTLLSGKNVYLGTINSDDSQSESFNVIFNKPDPVLTAQITYKNFNNQLMTKIINLPVNVYSKNEALSLGIIQPNNTPFYIISLGLIFGSWMIVRKIRKKKRLNKSQGK